MNTRKSLISRVSVHRTIPTRIPSYDFRASGESATTVQDAVEKQVFADCPDRGTTAAVGGKRPIDLMPRRQSVTEEASNSNRTKFRIDQIHSEIDEFKIVRVRQCNRALMADCREADECAETTGRARLPGKLIAMIGGNKPAKAHLVAGNASRPPGFEKSRDRRSQRRRPASQTDLKEHGQVIRRRTHGAGAGQRRDI